MGLPNEYEIVLTKIFFFILIRRLFSSFPPILPPKNIITRITDGRIDKFLRNLFDFMIYHFADEFISTGQSQIPKARRLAEVQTLSPFLPFQILSLFHPSPSSSFFELTLLIFPIFIYSSFFIFFPYLRNFRNSNGSSNLLTSILSYFIRSRNKKKSDTRF